MTHALPILRRFGWAGVLNLLVAATEHRGGLARWRVRRLIAAGWEVDAHSLTHPDLTTLSPSRLRYEVAGSRRWLRRHFHVPVDFFCYPSGRYDSAVIAAVRAAGFLGAETENPGFATPRLLYALHRIRVNLSDGVGGLAAKLAGRP